MSDIVLENETLRLRFDERDWKAERACRPARQAGACWIGRSSGFLSACSCRCRGAATIPCTEIGKRVTSYDCRTTTGVA